MKVVLLNGPPRCGKDTIGAMLSMHRFKFAKPIVDYMLKTFGIDPERVDKDEPRDDLFGRTVREVMIHYSERMCKPLFGKLCFGIWASQAIQERYASWEKERIPEVVFFTDSGFAAEAEVLAGVYGAENVLQLRIERPGHTFENDSRSYWSAPGIVSTLFENKGDGIDPLKADVQADIVPRILAWLGN